MLCHQDIATCDTTVIKGLLPAACARPEWEGMQSSDTQALTGVDKQRHFIRAMCKSADAESATQDERALLEADTPAALLHGKGRFRPDRNASVTRPPTIGPDPNRDSLPVSHATHAREGCGGVAHRWRGLGVEETRGATDHRGQTGSPPWPYCRNLRLPGRRRPYL